MIDWALLSTAFIAGIASSAHCVGMCGGINLALSAATQTLQTNKKSIPFRLLLGFQVGRVSTYTLLGLMVGSIGYWLNGSYQTQQVQQLQSVGSILQVGALIIALLIGLYLAGLFSAMSKIEQVGGQYWRKLMPLVKHILPVTGVFKALFLGSIWGLLPCALVYGMLMMAMAQASPFISSAIMLGFGLGTLPALLSLSSISQAPLWLKSNVYKRLSGVLLIALAGYGLWLSQMGMAHQH